MACDDLLFCQCFSLDTLLMDGSEGGAKQAPIKSVEGRDIPNPDGDRRSTPDAWILLILC